MKKAIIAISSSLNKDNIYVNEAYINAIIKNGGIPFIIPLTTDENTLSNLIETADALLLTGGYDVFPYHYGQDPKPKLAEVLPIRDEYEMKLIKLSIDKKIPILGICRGMQLLNVFEGGTLYQDLSYRNETTLQHVQKNPLNQVFHKINIEKDTLLHSIFNVDSLFVNSFHHQAIDILADNFKATSYANDGIIESIEHKIHKNIFAVQWHPEMLTKMNKIFEKFIKLAKKD